MPDFNKDQVIAAAATAELAESRYLPLHRISVTVRDGCVTLEGVVEWEFYRRIAESTVRFKPGVRSVRNRIVRIESD